MAGRYSIPADFGALMQPGGRAERVDLRESVRQNILLMLVSHWGSLRVDPTYGCAVWEHDFDSSSQLESRRLQLEENINRMIAKHEPRLDPGRLKVNFRVYSNPLPAYRGRKMLPLKKRIEMTVEGTLLETNQPFHPPPFRLYFSPVAIEQRESNG